MRYFLHPKSTSSFLTAHVMLLTLFMISMQGCSSTEKNEEKFPIETPQIEIATTSQSDVSEFVVRGEAGAAIYINGKKIGTIGSNGVTTITLEIPQDDESSVQTLVLKDEAGHESEPVVFTLHPKNTQTPEDHQQENNNSTDSNETNSSDNNVTTPKPTTNAATLTSLKLTADQTTLNKETNTTLKVMAIFSDNTTQEVTNQVTWLITPKNTLEIKNTNLKTLQDGNLTLQAQLKNRESNILHVNVYWEVNGYRLPPMPDETLNNATLLGIDVNNNGVRDDVERWIYATYNHPIERGIFMQSARAYQKVIVDPSKAHETVKYMDEALSCEFYMIENNEKLYKKYEYQYPTKELKKVEFNTLERHMAYKRYNSEFNGEVLSAPLSSKENCEFDNNGTLKKLP